MSFEIFGALVLFLMIGSLLYFFSAISEDEAKDMGVMTPKMSRDPEHLERLERETPLHIKNSLEEAERLARQSQEADYEEGEDGVLRKKK